MMGRVGGYYSYSTIKDTRLSNVEIIDIHGLAPHVIREMQLKPVEFKKVSFYVEPKLVKVATEEDMQRIPPDKINPMQLARGRNAR